MRRTVHLMEGTELMTKRMEGTDGTEFPKHTASLESVLVILEGSCRIVLTDSGHELHAGDTFIVPADVAHQVVSTPEFTAVHVMPRSIRFDFRA